MLLVHFHDFKFKIMEKGNEGKSLSNGTVKLVATILRIAGVPSA